MPSQEIVSESGEVLQLVQTSFEEQLFNAIKSKDVETAKKLICSHHKMNLNCQDQDELTPLQHACHTGNLELAKLLLDNGADPNFSQRKDRYTPLMFAAISSRANIVRLLLERGVDISIENCVNRNAAQMAAFVGQSKIVAIINSWISYEGSVAPYTKCRELEDKPRISSLELGQLLHSYIVYPSLHPVKLLLHIKGNIDLIRHANEFIYVMEKLSSKSLKQPQNEECLALKYYYLSYLIEYCHRIVKTKASGDVNLDSKTYEKCTETIVRRLIKRNNPAELKSCTQQLDHFILECLMKFPYTQLAIFKTMTFALTKREAGELTALAILTQTLNGPRLFGQPAEACAICGEVDKNKKCSRCKLIYYCGPLCQRADWFQHKKVCRDPEEQPLLPA